MPDTTNHATCCVCGSLEYLALIPGDEWICLECDMNRQELETTEGE